MAASTEPKPRQARPWVAKDAATHTRRRTSDEQFVVAAEVLGNTYWLLGLEGKLPLRLHDIQKNGDLSSRVRETLAITRKYFAVDPEQYSELGYLKAFQSVMPRVQDSAAFVALVTLERQAKQLVGLQQKLQEPGVENELRVFFKRAAYRIGGPYSGSNWPWVKARFYPWGDDYTFAYNEFERSGRKTPALGEEDADFWRLMNANKLRRIKSAVNAELASGNPGLRKQTVKLCRVLSFHPQLEAIVAQYADATGAANTFALGLVDDASVATAIFDATLRSEPERVWAFPPLVLMGAKRLDLARDANFLRFAVDYGKVQTQSWAEDILVVGGMVIFLIGVLLTGPLAIEGLALEASLAGVALADLAATGASAELAYLREREADNAGRGDEFSARPVFVRSDYSDTRLAGLAALLSGIAFVFSSLKLFKNWKARKPGTSGSSIADAASARLRGAEDATGTADKALRRGTDSRARFAEREWRPAGPKWSRRPGTGAAQEARAAAASGMRGGLDASAVAPELRATASRAKPEVQSATGSTAEFKTPETPSTTASAPEARAIDSTGTAWETTVGNSGSTSVVRPPGAAAPQSVERYGSLVPDTSYSLTQEERFSATTNYLTQKTEKVVGEKLEQATGLKIVEQPEASEFLRRQIPPGEKSPPITKPLLLKEPVVTSPLVPAAEAKRLGFGKPDYLYLTPDQIEVFEVTVDTRFTKIPQEKGIVFSGAAVQRGDPHKVSQLRKTLENLIRRYPDKAIVYNIQAIGQVPPEVVALLKLELEIAVKTLAEVKGSGNISIVMRADQIRVFR